MKYQPLYQVFFRQEESLSAKIKVKRLKEERLGSRKEEEKYRDWRPRILKHTQNASHS